MKKAFFSVISLLMVPLFLTGCFEVFDEEKMEETYGSNMRNPQQDMRFQAFQGRLLTAVKARDYQVLQRMMTANFGFDLQSPYEGPVHAFSYWNRYNLWPQLEHIVSAGFRPKDNFLVAPPDFATAGADPDNPFYGFRAGVIDTRNGYKLAYFVDDNPRHYAPEGPAALSGPGAAGTPAAPGAAGGPGAPVPSGTVEPGGPRVDTRPNNIIGPGNTPAGSGSYQADPAWQRGQTLAP